MDENNMTAAGQTAPAAAQTEAPAEAAGQTVTIGALRGAIERGRSRICAARPSRPPRAGRTRRTS